MKLFKHVEVLLMLAFCIVCATAALQPRGPMPAAPDARPGMHLEAKPNMQPNMQPDMQLEATPDAQPDANNAMLAAGTPPVQAVDVHSGAAAAAPLQMPVVLVIGHRPTDDKRAAASAG